MKFITAMPKQTLSLLLLLLSIQVYAQKKATAHVFLEDKNQPCPKIVLSDFEMITGHWIGSGLGGEVDELWMPARQGQLQGVFRLENNGQIIFTEYMSLVQYSIGWMLKIKHFSKDFEGWEDRDKSETFRLIKAEKNALYFSGISYIRPSEDELLIFVAFKQKDGSYREEVFDLNLKSKLN